MASTFFGLTIAYTGLQAAQTSINVTAHNISNVNTTGYSKQQASVTADKAINTYAKYGTLGSGVVVNSIDQLRDSYYDSKYRNNQSRYGEYAVKENYMTQTEDYLNEFVLKGYCTEYENYYTALETLSKSPNEESAKSQFINNALSLTDYINTLSTNLKNIQKDANNEIKDQVGQINSIAKNVAALNEQINQIEACGGTANDLRDQRSTLLDDLSSIVNVDVSEQEIGNGLTYMSVQINGQSLVDNYNYNTLTTTARTENRNASDADGLYDVTWEDGQSFDLYNNSLSGSLRALVDVRDGCNGSIETVVTDATSGESSVDLVSKAGDNTSFKGIPYYQAKLNEFIATFTSSVNDILTSSTQKNGAAGLPLFTMKNGGTIMTASTVTVNSTLLADDGAALLSTRYKYTDAVETIDLVNDLKALQTAKYFNGGTGAFSLESMVADVGIDSSKATTFLSNYTNIKTTIQNQRLSVMGVDEDEEGMDLLKYQQAYNLCSKMMSVMNEIYNKLINETGL